MSLKTNKKKIRTSQKMKYLIGILIFIVIIEIILSGGLTIAKYTNSISKLCGNNIDSSCNTVQNSKFSNIIDIKEKNGETFEFPLALMGFLYYIIYLFLIIYFSRIVKFENYKQKEKKEIQKKYFKLKKYLLYFGLLAFLSSLIFTFIQAFILHAFCEFCLFSALNSTIIFLISLWIFILKNEN